MFYSLLLKIAEGITSCCGWAKEGKRRYRERYEQLEKMTDEEYYAYIKRMIQRSKRKLSSCC